MTGGQGPEAKEGTEIVLSEEEIRQSVKAVAGALSSGVKLSFGSAAGEKIAQSLDYKAGTGLEKHLENFPGANKDLVGQILREIIAQLKGKS